MELTHSNISLNLPVNDKTVNITNFSEVFASCTNLTSIPSNLFESRTPYRYIFTFPTELGESNWWIKDVTTPSVTIQHHNNFNIPSRFQNNDIKLTFMSPVGLTGVDSLMEWFRAYSESITGRMGYASGYKKDVKIEKLDPTGVVVTSWVLRGACFKEIVFPNFDDNDICDVECTLSMDSFVLM